MAITSIDESRARRAAQRAVVADPLQYTPPEQQKPTVLGRQVETDEAAIAEKGIGARFVNDAALMAHGFQAMPAIMYEKGVVGSVKLLGEGVIQFGKDITGIVGLRGKEAQKETAEYYKNHPGFAVADAIGIASFGGGALLRSSLTTIAKNSIRTATEAAAKYGIERTIINNAIMATRSIISPARILGKERIIGTFEKGLEHAVRTGDTVRVVESMTANLIKQGVESGIASKIARETANDVSKQIIQQSAKLKNFDRVAHPVGTIFGEAKTVVGAGAARLIGAVEPTALGTILGAGGREAIAINKKAASQIERWAQKIVLEKGLPDTIENRAKELASWNDDVNYAALSAEGKFRHWENFVKTDIDVKQLRDLNPDASKTIVPVKAISKSGADAMVKTLDDNIEAIKGIIDSTPNIDPAQRSMLIWDKVVELLSDVGGRDFINYSTTLREIFGANANIDKLKKAIVSYTTEKPSLAIRKWTPEEKTIVDRIVKSGYQIGYAPTGKKITTATELVEEGKIAPLYQEARKYKTAEEFVGAQTTDNLSKLREVAQSSNDYKDFGNKIGAYIDYQGGKIEKFRAIYRNALGIKGDIKRGYQFPKLTEVNPEVLKGALGFDSASKIPKELTVYRGIDPRTPTSRGIMAGDYVTLSKESAKNYGSQLQELKVSSEDLRFIRGNKMKGSDEFILIPKGTKVQKYPFDSELPSLEQFYNDSIKTKSQLTSIWEKAQVGAEKISIITEQTFTDTRNWLGKALEDWGFSTRGTFAGAKGLAYKLNFTQNVINDIGNKFGATITIKKPIVINDIKQGVSRITIPIEKIHDWLNSHKDEIFKLRGKGGGGGLSKWEAFRPVTVSDLSVGDLTRIGFDADLAKAVKDVAGKSLREVSPAVTGMLEHVVDIMRSGDNIFSRFYDMTYKTALYSRYQSVAAVLFQIQQVTETRLVAAMMTKDWRLIPGIATTAKGATKALSFGERMVPEKVGKIITNAKTYLKDIVNEVSDAEMSISHEFLMKDVLKFAQDQVSASEFGAIRAEDAAISAERATRKIEHAADIVGATQTKAAWINYLGGNYTAQGARIGKALAKRFGLTLEEVFGDFVERVDSAGNTQKIYKYQNLINEMQGAVTQALGYKAGFQTAPLVKSLNIIWFPFRFQAKTIEITAKWFGSLDPGTRLFVLNNWVHTANFMGSEEGIEWRRTNKNMLYDILAYTTAWQQMGNSLEAISRGQLFGGNTGLIGGVPFGFIYNLAQALAILPEDPEQFDPATGKQFQFKEVPTKIVSERAFLTAVEEFVFMMLPGMPLYTLTSGSIRGVSWRHYSEQFIEQFYPWLKGGLTPEGTEEIKRKLKGETSRIGMEERRTIPQIIGEFKE